MLSLAVFLTTARPVASTEPVATYLADSDPLLQLPDPVPHLDPRYKNLWMLALRQAEAELRQKAATAIAQVHSDGLMDFSDAANPLLVNLQDEGQPLVVRLAAAQALIAIDARSSAEALLEFSSGGNITAAQIVEPALAHWKHEPARRIWKDRLTSATVRPHQLRLALSGLVALEESTCSAELISLVAQRSLGSGLRLHAARALAQLHPNGSEPMATKLAASSDRTDRLMAATALTSHDSKLALKIQLTLASDGEAAVAAIAWRHLLRHDSQSLVPIARKTSQRSDSRLRMLAAEAMFANPDPRRIQDLTSLLNDPHKGVRNTARDYLQTLGQTADWSETVAAAAMTVFDQAGAHELEQACLLLSVLNHRSAAAAIAELLTHEDPDVFITAAWSLKKLAVIDQAPTMLQVARKHAALLPNVKNPHLYSQQLGHLFEAFAILQFSDAEPLMREFCPRSPLFQFVVARRCAIWSLGHLHAGEIDSSLLRECLARLHDIEGESPEFEAVRQMAAVALGRMKAESAVSHLQRYYSGGPPDREIDLACAWAISEIEGTELIQPQPSTRAGESNWFLEPIGRH